MTPSPDCSTAVPAPAAEAAAPSAPGADRPADGPVNPAALTVEHAARLLSAAGRPVTIDMVQAAIDAGAPVDAQGRINLVDFMAFLEKDLDTRR